MPTRTFPGTYGIELLWWHSVTNGLEEPHGVRAYGCTKKLEDFLLCTRTTAKMKVLHQKTFGSYAYKNISWYIRNRTIMVALHNKLFRRPPRGTNVLIYQEMGIFSCDVRAQLPKSKCYTKNYELEWVQESVKIHTEHNYYGGIP